MPNAFQLNGAQPAKPTKYSPIWCNRFFSGLWTQRNPLRDAASTRIEEKYFGSRGDAMIDGLNVELSNRLTPIRRFGTSVYNSQTFDAPDYFYEFRLFNTSNEQIKVMVDTASALYDGTGPSTKDLVWTKSAGAGQTFMQYVANILYFGNGVDQKKWVQTLQVWAANTAFAINEMETFIIDPSGHIQQLTSCIVPISNVQVSSNTLTIQSAQTLTNVLTAGLQVTFSGVGTATFLNGQTVTIATVGANNFTATFAHGNYGPAADTGLGTVLQGGSPISGGSTPSWNGTLMGTTQDGTALWTDRGNPLENWGIVAPTQAPTASVTGSNSAWQANTYYSWPGVVIDSNGNLQQILTPGKTGVTTPAWATGLGSTTTDGTAVWKLIQLAASLVWQPHTAYTQNSATGGPYIVQAASDGTPCLYGFNSDGSSSVQISSAVTIYRFNHTGPNGECGLVFPTSTGSATNTGTGTSILFNYDNVNNNPAHWAALSGAGEITAENAISYLGNNYDMAVLADLVFPHAGQYTIEIDHKHGMYFGLSGTASYISGPRSDPANNTQTAIQGYGVIGANNQYSGAVYNDFFVVNIPTAGTYSIEIDFTHGNSGDPQQQLVMSINLFYPIPQPVESSTSGPPSGFPIGSGSWVAWTNIGIPLWNYSYDACRNQLWFNYGPASDFTWHSQVNVAPRAPRIIDPNGNTELPYRTGVSGATAPTFNPTTNGYTNDNPNLIWINEGPASAPGSGTVSTYNGGWSYCIALCNSLTNTVSNASPITPFTGNFIGSSGVQVSGGLPSVIDPQVDYVSIFRTEDGGATYFLIPGAGNTVFTIPLAQYQASGFLDMTLDANLNIELQAPLALQNTPPPAGIVNLTYHLNRVFGSVGNVVYWSSGPDTPIGNGNEGFAPLNSATFPSLVRRIVPTSQGAIIFTVSDIYIIVGQATSSFPLFPLPYEPGIGLRSYNALTLNGAIIYFFSSDSQVLSLDPTPGVSQIGFPIGDQFEADNWNPLDAYVTWHVSGSQDQALYVADGATGWFRLSPVTPPENGLMWAPFSLITGGVGALQSIEVSPGVHKLLLGSTTSGPILQRDLKTNADNGTPYDSWFTIGSLVLAHPGQLAELNSVTADSRRIGTPPTMSVRLNEVAGPYDPLNRYENDPPDLAPSLTTFAQRWYFSELEDDKPALCRHMQMRVDWAAENQPNELYSVSLFGGFRQEL